MLGLSERQVSGYSQRTESFGLLARHASVARDEMGSYRYSVSSRSVQATCKEACIEAQCLSNIPVWQLLLGARGPCAVGQPQATWPAYVLILYDRHGPLVACGSTDPGKG